ncbi:methyltransferase family protein [Paenibacillus cellulosilyticus]|uniref:Methyltransferase family protein n=1 Tax=Paenibacillus cellulosilyticus TaxID=375489 RepID=A0A2V2YH91_9BACL|nr:methyltransferase domain-containing protein [Paenibacillus cellulosilyticus]PWV92490.1 methyltransferase family protein [Paenibacillus cellulosilyticus]QKS47060.1 methyltransferase domain-containing protein [Paenibacillus cellulosilyticus]
MSNYEWDDKIDYLSRTRALNHNDDYMEFLVKSVWRITKPVRLIDFGCGYGYLGLKLLPLLPEGSTYTGIDAGEKLLDHARMIFRGLPYETNFIAGDLTTLSFEPQYDIAISHAFLMHMQDPQAALQRMIDSVVDGGKVICIESNWVACMAGYQLDGVNQSEIVDVGLLQRLFERDTMIAGKDGNIGAKLPFYMSKLGLSHIGSRVSDKVWFLNPNGDTNEHAQLLATERTYGFAVSPGEREPFIQGLISRGCTIEEANRQYEYELRLSQAIDSNSFVTHAPGMRFTFGTVDRSLL